jgi:hypothetical protein
MGWEPYDVTSKRDNSYISKRGLIVIKLDLHIYTLKTLYWLRTCIVSCHIMSILLKQNGQRRYKYLVLGRNRSYFVQNHSDSTKMFSETDIINILEFLIDNIFVIFGGRVFQQTVGIPMGTNLFLYSYEAYSIQWLLKQNEKNLAWSFNFTFRYVYDVLSLNNSSFGDLVDRIYPTELEI